MLILLLSESNVHGLQSGSVKNTRSKNDHKKSRHVSTERLEFDDPERCVLVGLRECVSLAVSCRPPS